MNTIIIGYRDTSGAGVPEVVCGPGVDSHKQMDVFTNAKHYHQFPGGYQRLEIYRLERPADLAIYISDGTSDGMAKIKAQQEASRKEAEDKRKADAEKASKLFSLRKAVGDASQRRNVLMGKLHVAKTHQRNAGIEGQGIGKRKDEIKQHTASVEKLQEEVDLAITDYDKAASDLESFLYPEGRPAETTTQQPVSGNTVNL